MYAIEDKAIADGKHIARPSVYDVIDVRLASISSPVSPCFTSLAAHETE